MLLIVDIIGASFYTSSQFEDGDLQQLIWNVQCNGSETYLLNCSFKDFSSCYDSYNCSYCYYGHTAGVRCYSKIILMQTLHTDLFLLQTLDTVLKEISD